MCACARVRAVIRAMYFVADHSPDQGNRAYTRAQPERAVIRAIGLTLRHGVRIPINNIYRALGSGRVWIMCVLGWACGHVCVHVWVREYHVCMSTTCLRRAGFRVYGLGSS